MSDNETPERKPDCTLSDGTPVYFDKRKIKPREWYALHDPATPDEDGETIMSRFAGLDLEYYRELNVYDYQLIWGTAKQKIAEPIFPNSVSASTGPS